MTETVTVPIRDFTRTTTVRFKIDDDVFEGVPDIPALVLVDFAEMTDRLATSAVADQTTIFQTMFRMVLTDESAERFLDRLGDKSRPISLPQLNEIIPWIMEQYGLRPMVPSSPSSNGSESQDGGTNSTVVALPVVSTSGISVANDSSTSSTQP